VIRFRSYLNWSITFLLGVGFTVFTDLGDLGRHLGGNKAIVGVFNGPVVYVNVGIAFIFLARVVVLVKNFTSSYFDIFGRCIPLRSCAPRPI
jgi:hypothetical protein